MKTLIQNANVFTEGSFQKKDLLFDENEILKIEEHLQDADAQVLDYTDAWILPGLVDTHVHLREPGYESKETIATGSRAAAAGGFTTIFAMPNTRPYPSDLQTMETIQKKIQSDACVRVIPFATITKNEAGKEPVDYKAFKEAGTVWFSDDGVGVQSADVMRKCMEQAAKEGVLFSCHTEDMNYRRPGACIHEGNRCEETGWLGIPSACESEQLIRDLKTAGQVGLKYHADHISAEESVEALRKAKAAGVDCSAEVTVHHLLLDENDVKGPNWKMNPPLRSSRDRQALIEGLETGALDFIANDHAPHTKEEKARPMDKAPFGIVSLETAFSLLYTEFVKRKKRWSLQQLLEWMALKPARRFGLEKTGILKEGYRPDFFIADLDHVSVIDPETFESKGTNTPFAGYEVYGQVQETWASGRQVYKRRKK